MPHGPSSLFEDDARKHRDRGSLVKRIALRVMRWGWLPSGLYLLGHASMVPADQLHDGVFTAADAVALGALAIFLVSLVWYRVEQLWVH